MSDCIRIQGIKAFGYHGVLKSENTTGQNFLIDIELYLDLSTAAKSDQVSDTVNYAEVTALVIAEIVGKPVALIEKLAANIADQIKIKFPKVSSVSVTVHKPEAPVGATVSDISVTITR